MYWALAAGECTCRRARGADELALRALATAYGRVVIAVRPRTLLCRCARAYMISSC
jgi:hypothetical protein